MVNMPFLEVKSIILYPPVPPFNVGKLKRKESEQTEMLDSFEDIMI